ncbi:MAG: hypothetical protein IJY28_00350 [Clostridia bacterium]|nr:hypothetical protein [Clostridia bacterium]
MNWAHCCFEWNIRQPGEAFRACSGTECVMQAVFADKQIIVTVKYDFNETPLTLTADAKSGDAVRLILRPYRIELYVNGRLSDEEWPCGQHKLASCVLTDCGSGLRVQPWPEEKQCEPAVLGTFRNAEGWKPEENVFVGDCMPYCRNGVYHVLYLKDRHHHRSKWGRGAHQWSQISSEDMHHWQIHPMAVEIDDPAEGSICTGSWIEAGKEQYLFYTIRMCDGSPATICRSVSTDGFHFEKDRTFSFILSDKYKPASARDPKVFLGADGLYHMFVTTSLRKERVGCLAHLVSEDLNRWQEMEEPIYIAPDWRGEPECPDYFYKDGWYYLVYSLRGTGYYQYSRQPFTGWQTPENPVIPCKSVPKAAIWRDRLIFTGFDGGGVYAGTMTFLEAEVQENGCLQFRKPWADVEKESVYD